MRRKVKKAELSRHGASQPASKPHVSSHRLEIDIDDVDNMHGSLPDDIYKPHSKPHVLMRRMEKQNQEEDQGLLMSSEVNSTDHGCLSYNCQGTNSNTWYNGQWTIWNSDLTCGLKPVYQKAHHRFLIYDEGENRWEFSDGSCSTWKNWYPMARGTTPSRCTCTEQSPTGLAIGDASLACSARNVCIQEFLTDGTFSSYEDFFHFECQCVYQGQQRADVDWSTSTECSDWIDCMTDRQDELSSGLEVILVDILSQSTSLMQLSQTDVTNSTNQCFDPTDESQAVSILECDCLPALSQACATDVFHIPTMGQCLADFSCRHSQVCDSWKNGRCTGDVYTGSDLNFGSLLEKQDDKDQQASHKKRMVQRANKKLTGEEGSALQLAKLKSTREAESDSSKQQLDKVLRHKCSPGDDAAST